MKTATSGAHACATIKPHTGTNCGHRTKAPYVTQYARLHPRRATLVAQSSNRGPFRVIGNRSVHATTRLPIASSKVRSNGSGVERASHARTTYSRTPLRGGRLALQM